MQGVSAVRTLSVLTGDFPDIISEFFHLRQNTYNLQNFYVLIADNLKVIICLTLSVTRQIDYGNSCLLSLSVFFNPHI